MTFHHHNVTIRFLGDLEEEMPLYEFECRSCGTEFEKLVLKAAEAERVKCPSCNSQEVEEKLSSFASVSKNGASNSNCAPGGG
jgi:putative FmdB family regulatory protein